MIGETYWTTGIILRVDSCNRWIAYLKFYDDGFCQDESTEGTLTTRYYVPLETAIDTLIEDALKLGISLERIGGSDMLPFLSYEGDGEDKDYPPPDDWREILQEQAARIGWNTYSSLETEQEQCYE